jgi:hypothetical protein
MITSYIWKVKKMFYRSFKLENDIRKPYRDSNKNLICPSGPVKLTLVNYTGIDAGLHGCLVAEISVYARVRNYRCKHFDTYNYVIRKHVELRDYRSFLSTARVMVERFKGVTHE